MPGKSKLVMAGIVKLFVYQVVQAGTSLLQMNFIQQLIYFYLASARKIMAERGEEGAVRPLYLREAFRRIGQRRRRRSTPWS